MLQTVNHTELYELGCRTALQSCIIFVQLMLLFLHIKFEVAPTTALQTCMPTKFQNLFFLEISQRVPDLHTLELTELYHDTAPVMPLIDFKK
jgi:hypothetical protein